MKPKLRTLLLGTSSLLAASYIQAADLFWDGADTGADAQGGTGTWLNGITSNWDTLATGGADSVWTNANNDTAIFGGTAGTVTLGSDVTVGGLDFAANNYIIDPGTGTTVTFGTAGTINNGGAANIKAIIAGSSTITKTGNGTLYLNGANTFTGDITISGGVLRIGTNTLDNGAVLGSTGTANEGSYAGDISVASGAEIYFQAKGTTQTLTGVISGAGGLRKGSSGTLILGDQHTYTGKTYLLATNNDGSRVSLGNAEISSFNSINETETGAVLASSSLGAPTNHADGTIEFGTSVQTSASMRYVGSGETTNRIMRLNFNASGVVTIDNDCTGGGLLRFTSAMTSNVGTQTGKLILRGTGAGEISANLPKLPTGGLEKQDAGTWTLGGANAYTTGTTVAAGTLTINGSVRVETTVITGGTLNGSGTLTFNVDGTAVDLIDISGTGTIDLSAFTLSVNEVNLGADQASYIIIDSVDGGSYTGTFASESIPAGYTVNYDFNGNGTQVALVSGASDPFDTWAGTGTLPGTVTFDGDLNGDGVQDGVAFLLGVANPDDDANGNVPIVSEDGSGNLVMVFNCLPSAGRGTAELRVAHSNTLAAFTATVDQVPDADDAVQDNGVTFVVDTITEAPLNKVTATIDNSVSAVGKLFGRLEATE